MKCLGCGSNTERGQLCSKQCWHQLYTKAVNEFNDFMKEWNRKYKKALENGK